MLKPNFIPYELQNLKDLRVSEGGTPVTRAPALLLQMETQHLQMAGTGFRHQVFHEAELMDLVLHDYPLVL